MPHDFENPDPNCDCLGCLLEHALKDKRPKTWGDYHREAIASGMDDASACHAADTAVP